MSFGGFGSSNTGGGFGGFGSTNNNNSTTGGGFGSNTNASTGGSMFGGNTGTAGGFGSTGGASPFGGNKPAFGAPATTSGGGLFGGGTSTSGGFGSGGGGGFGSSTNTGGGFGASSNTAGGLFGSQATKPATTGFGGTTGGSIFGGGASTGTGFGGASTNTGSTNAFGGGSNTGFGGTNTNNPSTGSGFGGFGTGNAASTASNNNSGTGGTPFSAFVEKDGTSTQNAHYQSITFQQPYQNKSFEELRVEDYMQGRKSGNTNGQAGTFGTSTGFGSFGTSNNNANAGNVGGGLFGGGATTNNNNASTGFGGFGGSTQQSNTGGFGGFGGTKPATGGFGQQPPSSATNTGGFGQTANSGGGLFGNSNNSTTGGFGGASNTGTTGGGLFGNNSQQQSKPAFGGFGGTSSNTNTGFGSTNNNSGGGLFGGGGANTSNTTGTGFGGFGGTNSNQQQQQSTNPFGASTTNTGFGGAQSKPATGGLFGSTTSNTGGGAFGQTQQQPQNTSVFGGGNTNTGSSLFGQPQNKPATGGLFGGAASQTNTGGNSLFGGLNQGQNQNNSTSNAFGVGTTGGSSLFGAKPAGNTGGSLFGNSTNNNSNAGGGLFGGLGQNQSQNQQSNSSTSLFSGIGNGNQNQQANNSSSLFGQGNNTQPQQAPMQQSGQLHTSLTCSPYGNEQLFASLTSASPPIGPLATPLSGSRPTPRKTPSLLASTRLNSPAHTPRGSNGSLGRSAGYGFSYSNYGTPSSAYSNSLTPGANSLLRQSTGFSRSSGLLSKSYSTSNLKGDGTAGEGNSLLRSGAFSPPGVGQGSYGRSSVRKLHIDRSLRSDLFSAPPVREDSERRQSKTVSFDNNVQSRSANGTSSLSNGSTSTALVRTEEPEAEQTPAPATRPQATGQASENEQANGHGASGLTTVPEDGEPARSSSVAASRTQVGKHRELPPGDYYMEPSLRHLQNMSRAQLQKVGRLRVGRENAGYIDFGPCDLTSVDLDQIMGRIVQIQARNATVYPDKKSTPAMGYGLNVPSVITLEQTWPKKGRKGRNGEVIQTPEERLIENLKKIEGTEFLDWSRDTGVWRFKVQHFTTYGLDDDDEDDFGESQIEVQQYSSPLSEVPASTAQPADHTMASVESSNVDEDTFQFKIDQRSHRSQQGYMPPGGFAAGDVSYDFEAQSMDDAVPQEYEGSPSAAVEDVEVMADSILSAGGPVQAPSPQTWHNFQSSQLDDEAMDHDPTGLDDRMGMPGAFSGPLEPKFPRSILKPSATFVSPQKAAAETWEEKLQQTLSPRKRDRRALRDLQQSIHAPPDDDEVDLMAFGQSTFGQSYLAQKSAKKGTVSTKPGPAFETSIDIMNSLWGQPISKTNATKDGSEVPPPKKQRLTDADGLTVMDADFLGSFRAKFAADSTLVYAGNAPPGEGMAIAKAPISDQRRGVCFARFTTSEQDSSNTAFATQQQFTSLEVAPVGEIPHARTADTFSFKDFEQPAADDSKSAKQEQNIWQLCSILFDAFEVAFPGWADDLPGEVVHLYESRTRIDAFATFWAALCPVEAQLRSAKTEEESALLLLTTGDVAAACEVLIAAKNFKLATIVSQLPADVQSQQYMRQQIDAWKQRGDWSEMSDPMRALYCVVAGSFCIVDGMSGPTESRAAEFLIAERFGLTWKQSFGLRVHFSGLDTLEAIASAYINDILDQEEKAYTYDAATKDREDPLLGLLRLAMEGKEADVSSLVEPLILTGSSFDTRLPWQLANVLAAADLVALPNDKADRLTYSYAAELELQGSVVNATWVLLHLHESSDRQHAIQGLLERNAGAIADPVHEGNGEPGTFEQLVEHVKVPAIMIWKAKALHAQAVLQDFSLQASYLLQADDADAAHDILLRSVAPLAVIEHDFAALQSLLGRFEAAPPVERTKWDAGGQVFAEFAQLMSLKGSKGESRIEISIVRLSQGLAAMHQTQDKAPKGAVGLEARVALAEMQNTVKKMAKEFGVEAFDLGQAKRRTGGVQDLLAKFNAAMAA